MINLLLYLILVAAFFVTVFTGRPALLYATAALFPATRAMPNPVSLISTATNLIAFGLLAGLAHKRSRARNSTRLPLKTPILIMVAAMLIGVAIRGVGELGGQRYLVPFDEVLRNIWYWITPFVVYAATFRLVDNVETARRVVTWCELSMLGECLITVTETVRYGRATAHLAEPNAAGAYFGAAAAFFCTGLLWETGRKKWIYLLGFVTGTNAVFNSLSRGGMVSALASCALAFAVFFLLAKGRGGFKVVLAAIVAFAALNFTIFVPQKVYDRFMVTFHSHKSPEDEDKLDVSSQERLEYWQIALEVFDEKPAGWGAFTFPQIKAARHAREKPKQAHNIYLQVLVEFGAQGLLAILILVFGILFKLYRTGARSQVESTRTLAFSLAAWWLVHMLAHIFGNPFFLGQLVGQFWMMVACLFRLEEHERTASPEAAQPRGIPSSGHRPLARAPGRA